MGFRTEVAEAAPTKQIAAVLSFAPDQSRRLDGSDILERLADAKQPVLDMLMSMNDAQLQPLPGLPHAVVVASAKEWRALIDRVPWLAETDSVRLDSNEVVATTL